jgi:hypothetical protein
MIMADEHINSELPLEYIELSKFCLVARDAGLKTLPSFVIRALFLKQSSSAESVANLIGSEKE